jgi:cytochrome c biogenesis protein CcmG/thiol:disulfide interchange protein DsbE
MKRYLIPLAVFLAVAVALGIGLTLDPSRVPSPLIGKPAPAFSAPDLHHPTRTVTMADLKGRVALVNVWASWCAACLDEHPYVKELAETGVPIYGINYKDTRKDALEWLDRYGNAYVTSILDADGRIGLDWGVYGVPETFVLDADGVIRHKHIGAITPDDIKNELIPLIEKLRDEADT